MSTLSKHHKELTDGKGKCSVPMWDGNGLPAGFCDKDAFGVRPECCGFRDAYTGEFKRFDGKYAGYVPGLACPRHGGPKCPGIEVEPELKYICEECDEEMHECEDSDGEPCICCDNCGWSASLVRPKID